jgi:nucleotide-binding universal stress UspA family protein
MAWQDPFMPPERIAVAIDFSPESERALEHAVAIARRGGASLVLVHVETAAEPLELGLTPDGALPAYQTFLVEELAESRRRLEELAASHRGGGLEVEVAVVEGFPDTALVETAAERAADLIALGTHGRTGLGRVLLGSVAEKVVRSAHRDVLVARGPAPAGGYPRVLVPTDFSPTADQALDLAVALAADGGEVVLFHGWQLPGAHYLPGRTSDAVLEPVRRAIEDGARAKADAAIAARAGRVTFRFEVAEGSAARGIEERAAGYDLVVMGSHGRRGVRRWLLGSLAESTVRSAPCTVVVVHGERS